MPTETTSTDLTKQQPAPATPKKSFQDLIDSPKFKEQITLALPKHLTADRFIRVLMTAALKQPLLLQCTQESIFKGIFDAAAAGLEIDGRRAHLVPFKNNRKQVYEATLIPDYKGIVELMMRSGTVSYVHADVVCENDEFEFDLGEIKKHKYDLKKERGKPYAVYCLVRMRDGTTKSDVMSKFDVEKIRRRSRASSDGPWVTDPDEMWKKTVIKRCSKMVPLSAEIRVVIEPDNDPEKEPFELPKGGLAGMIGAGAIDLPEGQSEAPAEGTAPAEDTNKPTDAPKPAAEPEKQYTPEERAAILKDVENLMFELKLTESKVMVFAHANKLAVDGQDEIGALGTAALAALKVALPNLKT